MDVNQRKSGSSNSFTSILIMATSSSDKKQKVNRPSASRSVIRIATDVFSQVHCALLLQALQPEL